MMPYFYVLGSSMLNEILTYIDSASVVAQNRNRFISESIVTYLLLEPKELGAIRCCSNILRLCC